MDPEQEAADLIQYHGPTKALTIATRRLGQNQPHAETIVCYIQGFHAGATTMLRHLANPGKN